MQTYFVGIMALKGTIAVLSASKDLEGSGPQGTPQMAAAARLPDWGRPSGCHRSACLAPGLGHSGNAGLRETGGRLGKVSRANADRRRRGAVSRVGFSLRTARRARRTNEAAESRLPSFRSAYRDCHRGDSFFRRFVFPRQPFFRRFISNARASKAARRAACSRALFRTPSAMAPNVRAALAERPDGGGTKRQRT